MDETLVRSETLPDRGNEHSILKRRRWQTPHVIISTAGSTANTIHGLTTDLVKTTS
jgi:hypothetical protein